MQSKEAKRAKVLAHELWAPFLGYGFPFGIRSLVTREERNLAPRNMDDYEALRWVFERCGEPSEEGFVEDLLITTSGFTYGRTKAQALGKMRRIVSMAQEDEDYGRNLFSAPPEIRARLYGVKSYDSSELFRYLSLQ